MRSRKIFYGWWMVAAAFGVQFLVGAVFSQAYGAYVVLLKRDFAWSATALAAGFSLLRLTSGLLGPLEGWLIDRYGPRAVMRVGMVIFAGGLMYFSSVDSLTEFYFAVFVIAIGSALGGFMPVTVAVVNWFKRRRATAISITSAGYAVGGLAVPLVVLSLETLGWRGTAFASGVIVLVAGLSLTQVIRRRPEDYGMELDGDARDDKQTEAKRANSDQEVTFTARQALRTPAFWFLGLGHASALLVISAVTVHLAPHINLDLGYSLSTAGLVFGLLTAMQLVGQIAGGMLGDRLNKRLVSAAAMGMHMVATLMVAHATSLVPIIGFAILFGLAMGIRGPLMQAMRADYFGRTSFGLITGLSALITMVGQTAGPIIAGSLADVTGTYDAGFTLLAVLAGLGSVFFILAKKPNPPVQTGSIPPLEASQTSPGDGD